MEKTPHEMNKNATRVSPLPCLVMIILSPLLLVYFILTLLFVPFDFLIFKTSLHHRDFGGKYGFLSGAHPDNELYTFIKKQKIKISYVAVPVEKSFVGYFFSGNTLIEFKKNLFWDAEKGQWRVHSHVHGASATADSYSLDEAAAIRSAEFKSAVGKECVRSVFLLEEKRASRAGIDAYNSAISNEGILLYNKKTLRAILTELTKEAE